ncbi:MAG TPA: hypothetical protein VIM61_02400 [Chthoniobacterales bacterium]
MMHDHGADDFENALERETVRTVACVLGENMEPSPAALNWPVELHDREASLSKLVVFADERTQAPVRFIFRILHKEFDGLNWRSR